MWHTRRIGPLMAAGLGLWFVAHLLVVSRYSHWWGGHAWGPRFLTELMPALTILMAPAVVWLWRSRGDQSLVAVLMGWSILLQAIGAYGPDIHRWSRDPVDIDLEPARLWDWTDAPFLYAFRAGRDARSDRPAARRDSG